MNTEPDHEEINFSPSEELVNDLKNNLYLYKVAFILLLIVFSLLAFLLIYKTPSPYNIEPLIPLFERMQKNKSVDIDKYRDEFANYAKIPKLEESLRGLLKARNRAVSEIKELGVTLGEKKAKIKELGVTLGEKKAKIKELGVTLGKKEAEIEALSATLRSVKATLNKIKPAKKKKEDKPEKKGVIEE